MARKRKRTILKYNTDEGKLWAYIDTDEAVVIDAPDCYYRMSQTDIIDAMQIIASYPITKDSNNQ